MYRICENDFGYFCIQKKVKFLWWSWWTRVGYNIITEQWAIYETKDDARKVIARWTTEKQRENNNWTCECE